MNSKKYWLGWFMANLPVIIVMALLTLVACDVLGIMFGMSIVIGALLGGWATFTLADKGVNMMIQAKNEQNPRVDVLKDVFNRSK